jgi:hypothetical protein
VGPFGSLVDGGVIEGDRRGQRNEIAGVRRDGKPTRRQLV